MTYRPQNLKFSRPKNLQKYIIIGEHILPMKNTFLGNYFFVFEMNHITMSNWHKGMNALVFYHFYQNSFVPWFFHYYRIFQSFHSFLPFLTENGLETDERSSPEIRNFQMITLFFSRFCFLEVKYQKNKRKKFFHQMLYSKMCSPIITIFCKFFLWLHLQCISPVKDVKKKKEFTWNIIAVIFYSI